MKKLVLLALAFALVACGGPGPTENPTPTPQPEADAPNAVPVLPPLPLEACWEESRGANFGAHRVDRSFDAQGRLVLEEERYADDHQAELTAIAPSASIRCSYTDAGDERTCIAENMWWSKRTERLDANGRVVWRKADMPQLGEVSVTLLRYDEQGRMLALESDADGDGKGDPTHGEYWTYDAAGNWTTNHTYPDVEEYCPDFMGEVTRDAEGRIVTQDFEPSMCSDSEHVQFTYDDRGNVVREEHDVDKNGAVDRVVSYDYGCWAK